MKNNADTIHDVLLRMLQWLHCRCEENGLRYYVIGGTMLGAIRHNGFIPWDDDIDIAMPRKDYVAFLEKYSNGLQHPYAVEYPNNDNKDYPYLYSKIYDTRTLLIENKRHLVKRGVFIDVFPLDGIGETYESAIANYARIYRKIHLHDMSVCAFSTNRKWYKNLSIILGRLMSPLFFTERYLNNKITNLCCQKDFDESQYVGNLVGNWGYREIMPREFFGMPTKYQFENITVYGVEKPHEYLIALYNDYMKLPPETKRISHHDYFELNLNKSYLQ